MGVASKWLDRRGQCSASQYCVNWRSWLMNFRRSRIGFRVTLWVLPFIFVSCFHLTYFHTDVVKSRIQLRSTPPTGTPVQYIAHELKMIVKESGL